MTLLHVIYLTIGAFVLVLLELFVLSSINENQPRAIIVSSLLLIFFGLLWFGSYFIFSPPEIVLSFASAAVIALATLFFVPTGARTKLKVDPTSERFDERDLVFSREEYLPGSDKYETYYAAHPDYQDVDDKMRRLPELLGPGGRYYDPEASVRIDSVFAQIEKLTGGVDGPVACTRKDVEAAEMALAIKQRILELGANEVGIARLRPEYVYSHVGRGPENWGEPIVNNHQFAIVFTLEMRYEAVDAAPGLPITEETAVKYLQAARISISIAEYIRNLGYPARAHIAGSNYQVILPALAHDAGLGELGRIGYLISPGFGPRIRLGAVTTDIPLIADRPKAFGVQDFCANCLKCAANCPASAIPSADRTLIRGVEKWKLDAERCYHYWRAIGTDCGLCMKVCPFSHPPTFVHNLVRAGISRSAFARRVSISGDDLFYGARVPVG